MVLRKIINFSLLGNRIFPLSSLPQKYIRPVYQQVVPFYINHVSFLQKEGR